MTSSEIYLTKKCRIAVPNGAETVSDAAIARVAGFNRNLASLGFIMSPELCKQLYAVPAHAIDGLYQEIVPVLRKMTGDNREFKPMYPNFPKQVAEASDIELYTNAMAHYWAAFIGDVFKVPLRWLPEYKKDKREPLPDEEAALRVVRPGTVQDFNGIFTLLVGSNGSISEGDKQIVSWFAENRRELLPTLLPAAIPQKENLTYLVGLLMKKEVPEYLIPLVKTATDVLRIAAVLSDGDVSLAAPCKFRRFHRPERRFFLQILEKSPAITEDMLRRPEVWKRLGRELRPGDYSKKFPKAYAAFQVVRNDEPFETFAGKVEAGIIRKEFTSVLEILRGRPGELARRLDHLLRISGDEGVIASFFEVADQVSTPVLLQVKCHFENRSQELRTFFPKGNTAKMQVAEKVLPELPKGFAENVAGGIQVVLERRFSKLPKLGKTYIDPALKTQMVPFSQRSASKSLRTLVRGSRIALPECGTLRFFIWWKDGTQRTDLDLSTVFYGNNWEHRGLVSYYNLKEYGCYHSGDITSAPKGAAEFIDIDIRGLLDKGIRYVGMSVYSFTRQPYKDLPECFAGWMARSKVQSGEIFEARTVRDRVDLTADSKVAIPLLVDIVDRQVIWTDLSLASTNFINNPNTNKGNLALTCKAIANLAKPNLYDLFAMHARARGTLSDQRDGADSVFSMYEGITPFDTDKIMAEFVAN